MSIKIRGDGRGSSNQAIAQFSNKELIGKLKSVQPKVSKKINEELLRRKRA